MPSSQRDGAPAPVKQRWHMPPRCQQKARHAALYRCRRPTDGAKQHGIAAAGKDIRSARPRAVCVSGAGHPQSSRAKAYGGGAARGAHARYASSTNPPRRCVYVATRTVVEPIAASAGNCVPQMVWRHEWHINTVRGASALRRRQRRWQHVSAWRANPGSCCPCAHPRMASACCQPAGNVRQWRCRRDAVYYDYLMPRALLLASRQTRHAKPAASLMPSRHATDTPMLLRGARRAVAMRRTADGVADAASRYQPPRCDDAAPPDDARHELACRRAIFRLPRGAAASARYPRCDADMSPRTRAAAAAFSASCRHLPVIRRHADIYAMREPRCLRMPAAAIFAFAFSIFAPFLPIHRRRASHAVSYAILLRLPCSIFRFHAAYYFA